MSLCLTNTQKPPPPNLPSMEVTYNLESAFIPLVNGLGTRYLKCCWNWLSSTINICYCFVKCNICYYYLTGVLKYWYVNCLTEMNTHQKLEDKVAMKKNPHYPTDESINLNSTPYIPVGDLGLSQNTRVKFRNFDFVFNLFIMLVIFSQHFCFKLNQDIKNLYGTVLQGTGETRKYTHTSQAPRHIHKHFDYKHLHPGELMESSASLDQAFCLPHWPSVLRPLYVLFCMLLNVPTVCAMLLWDHAKYTATFLLISVSTENMLILINIYRRRLPTRIPVTQRLPYKVFWEGVFF